MESYRVLESRPGFPGVMFRCVVFPSHLELHGGFVGNVASMAKNFLHFKLLCIVKSYLYWVCDGSIVIKLLQ